MVPSVGPDVRELVPHICGDLLSESSTLRPGGGTWRCPGRMPAALSSPPSPRASRFSRAKNEVAGAPPCSFSFFLDVNNDDSFSYSVKSHVFISEAWETKKAQRKWSRVMTPRGADRRRCLWVLCVLGCGGCLLLILQIVTVFRESLFSEQSHLIEGF